MTFLVIVVYLLIPNKSLPLKLFNIIKLLLSGPHRQLVCFPTAPCLFYDMFAIRLGLICRPSPELPLFWEALALCNGEDCGSSPFATINVAMILDTNYLRDTMAAMLSMLQHSTCPKNLVFHFLFAHDDALELFSSIKSTFLYLKMKIYRFDSNRVRNKISKSTQEALDQPLNYAKIYLADTIPEDVKHVIYLDSDLVVVDDIAKLYGVDMKSQGAVRKHTGRRCGPNNNNMLW